MKTGSAANKAIPVMITKSAECARKSLTGLLLILLPLTLFAQAGSSPTLRFNSTDSMSSGSASIIDNPMMPKGILKLAPQERYLLWVDLQQGKLNVLERNDAGGMELRQVIPVSIGKDGFGKEKEGDRKTPVGVYRLTSFLTDEQLIDFYGLGAFPLNYPNVIDRKASRTGSGIWLHGLPKDVSTRPLLDSDGCVVIDNESFTELRSYISTGITHMVLSDRPLTWEKRENVDERRSALEQNFQSWREAWEARDNKALLSYYASDYNDFNRDKSHWDAYKSRVNNGKKWIQVEASKVSFYADLANPELVTVPYYQDYKSSNYQWRGWKEQLWRESETGWQIIYEGNG